MSAATLEIISQLERRLQFSISFNQVQQETDRRLKRLALSVKMPGFRAGKVPLSMVNQQYGNQVRQEVLSDEITKIFTEAVSYNQLKVAGVPTVEPIRAEEENPQTLKFNATFEVFPDVTLQDFAQLNTERFTLTVGDAEVDKTLDILQKQKATYAAVDRSIQTQDRITLNFTGTLNGVAFEGGSAENFTMVAGSGNMLPDFETGVIGLRAGEEKTIDVAFPADYFKEDLAGQTAQFQLTIQKVEAPQYPDIDAQFAKDYGIASGDIAQMRQEVLSSLQREVTMRLKNRTKIAVMDVLKTAAQFDVPKALIESERQRLITQAKEELQQSGITPPEGDVAPEIFRDNAENLVRLGLIFAEVVSQHQLQPTTEQVRAQIVEMAQSYENPQEVIDWYYADATRLNKIEGYVIEDNVVEFVLSKTKVTETPITFDELMEMPA